jgi:alkaline phosphatase D
MMDGGVGYPLYDLTSSGLNQAFQVWRPYEPNRNSVATMNFGNNFGLVTIDWDRDDPRLSLQIRDEEGDVTIQEKLPLSTLQPNEGAKPAGPDVAAEALKHVGKEYAAEMEVRATGVSKTRVFLNSEKDFKGPRNFTVVIDLQAAGDLFKKAGIDPAKAYADKKVRVTGVVSLFQERPQIVVKDPAQIRILNDE